MKKLVLMLLVVAGFGISAMAQDRTKISDGLYLVSYGDNYIIEDDIKQQSISLKILSDGINRENNEKIYKVVCGKWTRRVVKDSLNAALAAGIAASGATGGTSLIISSAMKLAGYIYDDACEYYGEK